MKHRLAVPFFLLAVQTAAAAPAGLRALTIPAEHHGREMSGAVWYPSAGGGRTMFHGENGVFYGTEVLDGARMADGPFPVIVVSHGLGGNIGALGWLSAGLARAGALVNSVNHPNSTTWDYDLQEGLKHWTRVQDLQAALHYVAAQPELAAHADFSRTYAVGFSAGGWTALAMGGLRADLEGYAAHCETAPPSPFHCSDLTRRGADLEAYSARDWNAGRKDDRIRAAAAIDPALTYGLGKAHALDLIDKVLLIGLGTGETRLPATDFSATGSGFAAHLPEAEIEIMAPAAHFSALLPCKPRGAGDSGRGGRRSGLRRPARRGPGVAARTDRGPHREFPRLVGDRSFEVRDGRIVAPEECFGDSSPLPFDRSVWTERDRAAVGARGHGHGFGESRPRQVRAALPVRGRDEWLAGQWSAAAVVRDPAWAARADAGFGT